jgi:hypothetical protein
LQKLATLHGVSPVATRTKVLATADMLQSRVQ